jgi:DNA polymerase-3 subunit delta'
MLFSQIIGQRPIRDKIIGNIDEGRISHAQLWLGNAGAGVLPLALAYVQYLFCENKQDKDSCGQCSSCQKVKKLQHPDLHFSFPLILAEGKTSDVFYANWRSIISEAPYFTVNDWVNHIDPKGRAPIIGAEESQNMIKKLTLKSFEGGYKVMIIWMAELMNEACSNKILKMLEEPPKNTLFLLLAENADMILPTILSRTQIFKIPAISHTDISAELINTKGMSLEDADLTAHLSNGSWIKAMEYTASSQDTEIQELFVECMRIAYKKDVIAMLAWANKMAALTKEQQKTFFVYALHIFRQSILFNYTQDKLIKVSESEKEFISRFSPFITGNNIKLFYDAFSDSHYHIQRNANQKILFTDLVFGTMKHIHVA